MSEWKEVTLGSISSSVSYGYTASANSKEVGPKFLRITDIVSDQINWDTVPYCEISSKNLEKYLLNCGDIVIARTGATTGSNAIFKGDNKTVFASYLIRFRINPKEADCKYVSYVLKSPKYYGFISGSIAGSAQPGINAKTLSNFSFPLPPLPTQKKIASILSSLDDKIEINTRMNKVLEEIARALFHRWFVEFEFPDAEGRPYKSSGGKMVDSEMGSVPEGWVVGTLGDIIELSYGKPLKEENRTGGGFPVYGSNGVVGWHKEWLVSGPGIIVGRKGNAGTVTWSSENFFPIDTTFYVIPKSGSYRLTYIYRLLKTLNLSYLTSDSAVPGLNRNAALTQKILIPDTYTINEYETIASSLFSQIYSFELENRTLIKIRDTLLPKLMSGEIEFDY